MEYHRPREAIQRPGVELLSGQREVRRVVNVRLAAMCGNKRIFDDDVFAPGSLQSCDMPVVIDLILFGQQKKRTKITDRFPGDLARSANRSQHDSTTVITA